MVCVRTRIFFAPRFKVHFQGPYDYYYDDIHFFTHQNPPKTLMMSKDPGFKIIAIFCNSDMKHTTDTDRN